MKPRTDKDRPGNAKLCNNGDRLKLASRTAGASRSQHAKGPKGPWWRPWAALLVLGAVAMWLLRAGGGGAEPAAALHVQYVQLDG